MSTFVKKATSAVAGLAIVFSIVSPIAGVSAALSGVEAANQLATLGVVVDQSANPADYRLGDNLPRKEAVKVMMNLSSIAVVDNCAGLFTDLSSADWACKYAETARVNGLVAANATFRPDDLVSKIEALKMVFQGMGLEKAENADWRVGYVDAAVSMGIATSFSDYNTPATRAEMFIWAAEAINMDDEVATEDPLCDLLGICEEEEEETDEGTDTPVVTGSSLQVSVSPLTPAATTIPGGVNGLTAVAYDFTAGSSDVTVSQVSVKRTGLSDRETLESLAIFVDNGRVSSAKSDNQDNDTTAQINLDNGGVVVQAGETITMYVVVDVASIGSNPSVESDEFALELVDVVANSTVVGIGARGNTMRIGSVDAPTLTFRDSGTVANPTLGEVAADIFEFEIDNSSDEDVEVETITFEGSSDAADDLRNFELLMGNDVVATTAMMSGDYLTFNVGGLTIQEDRTEDFTVRADVIDGAGDTIEFRIDQKLDITANSTKFSFGASVDIDDADAFGDLGSIEIEAGELTFVEVDAPNDEIRENKDNVVLGSVKITNVAGQSLEMQEFGVEIEVDNNGTSELVGNANGSLTVIQLLEDVELYNTETGSSYELTAGSVTTNGNVTSVVFSDNNIDVLLPQGTTTWAIRADTAEDIDSFDDVRINMIVDLTNDVYVVETSDDQEVTDKTPSSLSFKAINGAESGATISLIPLSNTDVVRGSSDVVALQYTVEAEQTSDLVIDEMTVRVESNQGPSISSVDGTSPTVTTTYTITPIAIGINDIYQVYVGGALATTYSALVANDATGLAASLTSAGYPASVVGGNVSLVSDANVNVLGVDGNDDDALASVGVTSATANTYTATVDLVNPNGTFTYGVSVNVNALGATAYGTATSATALAAAITADPNASATASGNRVTITSTVGPIVITAPVTTGTATNVPASSQEISEVKLYKGSISAGNLLDTVSGSDIGTSGDVTFDDMGDVMIMANGEQVFVVTVSFVDGVDAVNNSPYVVSLTKASIDDDENDNIDVTGQLSLVSARSITVNNAGTIATLVLDAANEDNEFDKLALAGGSSIIASLDVRSNNESIDVETVTVTLGGVGAELNNSVASANLLLNGVVVATASNTDISNAGAVGTIVFDDITALIIPETTSELAIRLNTANIGKDEIGAAQSGLSVTAITLSDAEGAESGKVTPNASATVVSRTMDIVAAVVAPSVVSSFGTDDQNAELRLVVDGGNNTTAGGDAVQAELTTLKVEASSVTTTGNLTVFNSNGTQVGTAAVALGNSTSTIVIASDSIGNDNEVYRIETTAEGSFRLAKDGVTYTINGAVPAVTTKLENTLTLGQYADSN